MHTFMEVNAYLEGIRGLFLQSGRREIQASEKCQHSILSTYTSPNHLVLRRRGGNQRKNGGIQAGAAKTCSTALDNITST